MACRTKSVTLGDREGRWILGNRVSLLRMDVNSTGTIEDTRGGPREHTAVDRQLPTKSARRSGVRRRPGLRAAWMPCLIC